MAQVDVSELLHDPDFVDEMGLVVRQSAENNFGENLVSESTTMSIGSIQPVTGEALQRMPEALRTANVRSFWYQGSIAMRDPGQYTDILTFKGVRYQIQMIFDWTNWGQGWSEGLCVAEKLS